MKITISASSDCKYWEKQWPAEYTVIGEGNAHIIKIDSRSNFQVVVSCVVVDWGKTYGIAPYPCYCIAVPEFNVVVDGYEDLLQTNHPTDSLIKRGIPAVDALTVAQVLHHAAKSLAA